MRMIPVLNVPLFSRIEANPVATRQKGAARVPRVAAHPLLFGDWAARNPVICIFVHHSTHIPFTLYPFYPKPRSCDWFSIGKKNQTIEKENRSDATEFSPL